MTPPFGIPRMLFRAAFYGESWADEPEFADENTAWGGPIGARVEFADGKWVISAGRETEDCLDAFGVILLKTRSRLFVAESAHAEDALLSFVSKYENTAAAGYYAGMSLSDDLHKVDSVYARLVLERDYVHRTGRGR